MHPIVNKLKHYQKNLFLEVFLFFVIVLCFFVYYQFERLKVANQSICSLLQENYINKIEEEIIQECFDFTKDHVYWHRSDFLKEINLWLSSFNISHLYVYNEAESKKMWQGISHETGVIAKKIFGNWLITKVLNPNAQVKVGDHILKINGKKVRSADQVLNEGGIFEVLRDESQLQLQVELKEIKYDDNIIVKKINDNWDYLKIPTFRSDYFSDKNITNKLGQLQAKSLIVDLRDNLGGNFVATLRVLSALMCKEKRVGKVFNTRTLQTADQDLENDLNDIAQIMRVTESNPVYLKTFATQVCRPIEEVRVLINERTASVSELFLVFLSQNIKAFKSYGARSAGQMLLAIWYPIDGLGSNIMMSIPYAWATALDEKIIEGHGIEPSVQLSNEDLYKFKNSHDPLLDYLLSDIGSKIMAKQL